MTCRICTELGETCQGMYRDCPQKEEDESMDSMKLHDVLEELHIDVVKYNEMHNFEYFKKRLEKRLEEITDELKNEAICILENLTIEEIDDFVNEEEPEKREKRRENLESFLSLCEQIVGV